MKLFNREITVRKIVKPEDIETDAEGNPIVVEKKTGKGKKIGCVVAGTAALVAGALGVMAIKHRNNAYDGDFEWQDLDGYAEAETSEAETSEAE